VKIESGEVVQQKNLGRDYFGEGITFWKDDLFQLTDYRDRVLYDAKTFASKRSFNYKGEDGRSPQRRQPDHERWQRSCDFWIRDSTGKAADYYRRGCRSSI
jgi:hypothetical protein